MAHCPSNEIYDMLMDHNGFLWIAHNLGLSRYDGVSFTNFSNADQTAISVTDLVEDRYGRIWCHNFNGQIFYIQDDKMHYLKEYDFRNSINFPGIVLYGDEIVSPSSKGFFVCNTANLKCHYEKIDRDDGVAMGKMCVLGGRVFSPGGNCWFVYEHNKGAHKIPVGDLRFDYNGHVSLESKTAGDTAFLLDNQKSALNGFRYKSGRFLNVFTLKLPGHFNTLSLQNGQIWVNTQNNSFCLNKGDSITGYDLTSIAVDREGNKWYGSLTKGLLVSYNKSGWQPMPVPNIDSGDCIKFINKAAGRLIYTSQYGTLIISSARSAYVIDHIVRVPPLSGNIEHVQQADSTSWFVEASWHMYVLNPETAQLNFIIAESVKDVALNNTKAYMAVSSGLRIENADTWQLKNFVSSSPPFSLSQNMQVKTVEGKSLFMKQIRCRAVAFDNATNSLLVSFSDGLHRIKEKSFDYVFAGGKHLYVSSMAHWGAKIYAGTFNDGLFSIEGTKVKRIPTGEFSHLDAIVRVKACNNNIWIFGAHSVLVLDAKTDTIINNLYPLPVEPSAITDAEEDDSTIYLATTQGMYRIPKLEHMQFENATPRLLYTLVNNKDTVYNTNVSLTGNENNLIFKLAIPIYKNADQLLFKYRLVNGGRQKPDEGWYYTQDAQRDIQFNALKPGAYTLEILTMQNNDVISRKPLYYHFIIMQPWYNTWWFYASVMAFTASVFFMLYQYRLRQALKIERVRSKISGDLHDDIGSTLSSINVYSQLAKDGSDNRGYINAIHTNTLDIINNLDDLVWNINPKNDTIDHLFMRMRLFCSPVLRERGMECVFKTSTTNKGLEINTDTRVNIYLVFKEIINNALKHSDCTECKIFIIQKGKSLRLVVKDNGRGFNAKSINRHRTGLNSMLQRAKNLKGDIVIKSEPGQGTEIRVNCRLK